MDQDLKGELLLSIEASIDKINTLRCVGLACRPRVRWYWPRIGPVVHTETCLLVAEMVEALQELYKAIQADQGSVVFEQTLSAISKRIGECCD